jgi:hypothetical protein
VVATVAYYDTTDRLLSPAWFEKQKSYKQGSQQATTTDPTVARTIAMFLNRIHVWFTFINVETSERFLSTLEFFFFQGIKPVVEFDLEWQSFSQPKFFSPQQPGHLLPQTPLWDC